MPQQKNGRDCGLFPPHFLATFMSKPEEFEEYCRVCPCSPLLILDHADIFVPKGEVPPDISLESLWYCYAVDEFQPCFRRLLDCLSTFRKSVTLHAGL